MVFSGFKLICHIVALSLYSTQCFALLIFIDRFKLLHGSCGTQVSHERDSPTSFAIYVVCFTISFALFLCLGRLPIKIISVKTIHKLVFILAN